MIYQLSQFEFPDSAARLYPETPGRDWVLEIGFGDGRFWPEYLREQAEQSGGEAPNYLGVEVSGSSLQKAARRLERAGLGSVILTKLPALVLLREVVPARGLSRIIVNFPDPWPRQEHLEHRLLRVDFFSLAASRLRPGGELLLTTDHQEYFEFALGAARESGVMAATLAPPPPAALRTKYALKWQELGLGVQHVRFTPTRHPELPPSGLRRYPASPAFKSTASETEEEEPVPHAVLTLESQTDLSALLSDFEKVVVQQGGATVVLLDVLASLSRQEVSFLAHVVEGELTQEVLVGVTRRPDGSLLVRLAKFGGPLITAGVKAAVGAVTAELLRRGAAVRHSGY